ncbi:MAG: hypothetical protein ABW174_14165 [Flavitalea sp.]
MKKTTRLSGLFCLPVIYSSCKKLDFIKDQIGDDNQKPKLKPDYMRAKAEGLAECSARTVTGHK